LAPWCKPKEQNHAVNTGRAISASKTRIDHFYSTDCRGTSIFDKCDLADGPVEASGPQWLHEIKLDGFRVGPGMPDRVLADLRRRLDPLVRANSPLSAPPPRKTRFGSPHVLSRVH